jgi:Protein of unknown function (DUF2490)
VRKRILLTLFIFWKSINVGWAQRYSHVSLWTRLQVIAPLTPRWNLTGTIHYRRQNNSHLNTSNLVASPLLLGEQALFTYRTPNEKMLIHALQATHYLTNQLLGSEIDFNAPENREWRLGTGVEFLQNPTAKFQLRERIFQEIRFIRSNDYRPTGRVRGRVVGRYQLSPLVSLNGVTEVLFHNPPVLNGQKPIRFAQFWLGSSLLWRLGEHLSLETGYTYIMGRRQTIIEFDDQHVINIHVGVRI